MEEQWTMDLEDDLQALAKLAALHVPEQPISAAAAADATPGPGMPADAQRAALAQLTLDAYEAWAATYPGAAQALESSLEGARATSAAQEVAQEIRAAQVAGAVEDWVDDEGLTVLYGPEPDVPWCPPVVQVEQYLTWSLPALKARVVGWFQTWPANAPLLPS